MSTIKASPSRTRRNRGDNTHSSDRTPRWRLAHERQRILVALADLQTGLLQLPRQLQPMAPQFHDRLLLPGLHESGEQALALANRRRGRRSSMAGGGNI